MRLTVYKGFSNDFLKVLPERALLKGALTERREVLSYDKRFRKQLNRALLDMSDDDQVWLTYEEFSLIKNLIDDAIQEDGLQVEIRQNNLLPDCYPLPFAVSEILYFEILSVLNGEKMENISTDCTAYLDIYNNIISINGHYYGSFYNYEYEIENKEYLKVVAHYPMGVVLEESMEVSDYNFSINNDLDTYLRDFDRIRQQSVQVVGIQVINGAISQKILRSFLSYCAYKNIRAIRYHEILQEDLNQEQELIAIAQNDIKITSFKNFRKIRFYKNPDISKEVMDISQSQIIKDIIHQAERSYDSEKRTYRDIFITASTGAGKSLMFQVPAVYLAKHYHKLTIIIEPVKALMQDQKENLICRGYTRVEVFNSDLITQVEKEAVLKKIKEGEVDLLYLSPETLLSYSIETIIGDREIGLIIVDEAHIVTTWGMGFRPDYWYLGSYINRLRHQLKYGKRDKYKTYQFPICAFTATAINGGADDSIGEIITSLTMENPIKYIGYVKRDDIDFDITVKKTVKLGKSEYEENKAEDLKNHLAEWLKKDEKTIVYFPYAALASEAEKGVKSFGCINANPRVRLYTGRNTDDLSTEMFNAKKLETFDKFRRGEVTVMLATKAFGMGIDVDDIKNVYHYAVSGNLGDYLQEVGRAARSPSTRGKAILDSYINDVRFANTLFGMSQIRQYQIKQVLSGIYDTYKNKHESRNFLISPQAFTYIFNDDAEDKCINKLKTCLMMIEKDFNDKYTIKVLISRPQSMFTKAYVVIDDEYRKNIIQSKYGQYFKFIQKKRLKDEYCGNGIDLKTNISDMGDVYAIDLKEIWEKYHANISFPQFKYWYFNAKSTSLDKVEIMPEIREYIHPRQCIRVEARGELLLKEIRDKILEDFEYIGDCLYEKYRRIGFSKDDFIRLLTERYGITRARLIANSLFELVDPNARCIKHVDRDAQGRVRYTISTGNFKEQMRRAIVRAPIVNALMKVQTADYASYIPVIPVGKEGNTTSIALKLLSIFDYITYELAGGEEPEIFIRLNDPRKVKNIVYGYTRYTNSYATRAQTKHKRDVAVLQKFFHEVKTNEDRWNYIEEYFLGYDVLHMEEEITKIQTVPMRKAVDKGHSYGVIDGQTWKDLKMNYEESLYSIIDGMLLKGVPVPEYISTVIKKSDLGKNILMSWPSKDVLLCAQETDDFVVKQYKAFGWKAFRIFDVIPEALKEELD